MMCPKFLVLVARLLNFWEDNTAIPITATYNLAALIQNQNGLIKFFYATVYLFDTILNLYWTKLELPVTTKWEWSIWIEVVGPR